MNHPEQIQFWPDINSGRFGAPSTPIAKEFIGTVGVHDTATFVLNKETRKQLEEIDGKVAATKHDNGKTDWSLLPWDAVEEIIKVLQFGAGKYSPWNWAENGGFKFNRLFNSSMRHFVAWFWRREDLDPETGLSHMAHLGCNILFLLHYVLNGNKFKNNDNRPNLS